MAKNYVYEWYKLENNDTAVKIGPKRDQPLIEYQEEMIKPPGLVLTLGKIEVRNKCEIKTENEFELFKSSGQVFRVTIKCLMLSSSKRFLRMIRWKIYLMIRVYKSEHNET